MIPKMVPGVDVKASHKEVNKAKDVMLGASKYV